MDNEALYKKLKAQQAVLKSQFDLIKLEIEEMDRLMENILKEMNNPGSGSKQQING